MRYFDLFSSGGYHSTVLSTYAISHDAFESVVLRRLRGAGVANTIVLTDEAQLALDLSASRDTPRHAGRRYAVVPIRQGYAFHPKIVFQVGRNRGRLLVGSANLTASGLAGNLEVAASVTVELESDHQSIHLLTAAWRYLKGHLDPRSAALSMAAAWLEERSPWLGGQEDANALVTYGDDTAAGFFTDRGNRSITSQYIDAIGRNEPIDRLIVVSTYWDDRLECLRQLLGALPGTPEAIVFADPTSGYFPVSVAHDFSSLSLKDARHLHTAAGTARFVHAKTYLVQSATYDHLLVGSANCSVAGLGLPNSMGINAEACLYRRQPLGTLAEALGLDQAIDSTETDITADQFTGHLSSTDEKMEGKRPTPAGRVDVAFDQVLWYPPKEAAGKSGMLALHGSGRDNILSEHRVEVRDSDPVAFSLPKSERPVLASVGYDSETGRRWVTINDVPALRGQRQDPKQRSAQRLLDSLSVETSESWLFVEVLTELDRHEAKSSHSPSASNPGQAYVPRARDSGEESDAATPPPRIGYDAFVRGRTLSGEMAGPPRIGLQSGHSISIRQVINRILGLNAFTDEDLEEDNDEDESFLDMGDETANGTAALENADYGANGVSSEDESCSRKSSTEESEESSNAEAEEERARLRRRKASAAACEEKVNGLIERLRGTPESPPVNEDDIFRVRLILTVLMAMSYGGSPKAPAIDPIPSTRVLPAANPGSKTTTWPRLMGRLLSAITQRTTGNGMLDLEIDPELGRISDTLLEAWGTCFWCMQASLAALSSPSGDSQLQSFMERLGSALYAVIGLRGDDLKHPIIETMFETLSTRHAAALGLDGTFIWRMHCKIAQQNLCSNRTYSKKFYCI